MSEPNDPKPPTAVVHQPAAMPFAIEQPSPLKKKRRVSFAAVTKACNEAEIGYKDENGKIIPDKLPRGIPALALIGQWSKDHDERNFARGVLSEEYVDLIQRRECFDKFIAEEEDTHVKLEWYKLRDAITYQIITVAKEMARSENRPPPKDAIVEQTRQSFPANQPVVTVQSGGNANIVVSDKAST